MTTSERLAAPCRCRGRPKKGTRLLLLFRYFVIMSHIEAGVKGHHAAEFQPRVHFAPSPIESTDGNAPAIPDSPSPLILPSTYKLHRKHFLLQDLSSAMVVHAQSPNHGLRQPSLGHSIYLSKPSLDLHSGPSFALTVPPALDNAPAGPSDNLAPSASAEAPSSPHSTGCCHANMVNRRDCQECDCVYPIVVELFVFNVSFSSNGSDLFLKELASQLQLNVSQFQIENFYVVGVSDLNITIYITPRSGISFSDHLVKEMNSSLTYHRLHIAGGYSLINLTSFKPLAPAPAPVSMSPTALPPSISSAHEPNKDDNEKSPNIVIILGLSVGAMIILVIFVATICLCTLSKRKLKISAPEVVKPRTADTISVEGSLPHPTSTRFLAYEELKEATNNFEAGSMLGEGGFGRVFKGVLHDGTPVAIKKLTSGGHQGGKEFLVEVEMLSRLHHRNLVKLVGYYSSRDSSQNLLCYELVPNGSLESWLHGHLGSNLPLDWDTRMKIALDAARGLAYLHEDSQPCVIHRDFKASNILLENDFHAKVSDFGLAKQAPEGQANYLSTRVMGTFGYVAPEYAMTGHLLVKSDVYSYGVVLLELLTGRKPVEMSQPSGQENLVTWARPILRDKDRLEDLADPRLAGKFPKDDFLRVCTIAAACVAPEASQRPTMGEVVQSLKMVQRSTEQQEPVLPSSAPHNVRRSSTTYESDVTSPMFSSGAFSGLSVFENDNMGRTTVFSEDLHEGR